MRTTYLVLGAAVLSSVANAATVQIPPISHTKDSDVPQLPELDKKPESWSNRLRNGFREKVLGQGKHGQREHDQKHRGLASTSLTKYAGDIVLRFNLTNQAEGTALVEASQVLLLDVWSSTKEHVDVRLPENEVGLTNS